MTDAARTGALGVRNGEGEEGRGMCERRKRRKGTEGGQGVRGGRGERGEGGCVERV